MIIDGQNHISLFLFIFLVRDFCVQSREYKSIWGSDVVIRFLFLNLINHVFFCCALKEI